MGIAWGEVEYFGWHNLIMLLVDLWCRLLSLHGSMFVISDIGIAHLISLYTLGYSRISGSGVSPGFLSVANRKEMGIRSEEISGVLKWQRSWCVAKGRCPFSPCGISC